MTMTKTFGEDLIESMNQALAHAEGKAEDTRVTTIQVPDDLASTERPEADAEFLAKAQAPDPRILALVRLLARTAAEEDFAKALKALKDKSKP